MATKNFIAKATANKGGLHRSLHVPADKPVPPGKLAKAAAGAYGPKAEKQAHLAQTLESLPRKGAKK